MSIKSFSIGFVFIIYTFITSAQTVENLEYHSEGDKVIITYDIVNCAKDENYDVTLIFEELNTSNKLFPKSISGDINFLSCGNKKISWDVRKDYNNITGKYYPVLSIKKSVKSVKDIDGNVYKTVLIGSQLWFAENLRTSKYNDGTPIPNVINNSKWKNLTSGAWCCYNNDISYNSKYGKLYNGYVVLSKKNICPKGWHVPDWDEWAGLQDYLGGESVAGDNMKEIGTKNWLSPNENATNSSGFTGLPGGYRDEDGNYNNIGKFGDFWTSNEGRVELSLMAYDLNHKNGDLSWEDWRRVSHGKSLRCISNEKYTNISIDKTKKNDIQNNKKNLKVIFLNPISDIDGNIYKTVQIGNQIWFAENLKTTRYNDGTKIPNVTDSTKWGLVYSGAWCYYNNDEKYNKNYGKLYNWYVVNKTENGDKNVCPSGWHVPEDLDWHDLIYYLGGEKIAGGKMKDVSTNHWKSQDDNASNSAGFTGLPGGYREYDGRFKDKSESGNWWSSTEFYSGSINAFSLRLSENYPVWRNGYTNMSQGLSIRCIKD